MIARRSFLIFINSIITVILGYVSLFFVARFMGPTALGTIGYALSFIGIFSFITDFGFNNAHIKKMNSDDKKKCIGTFMTIKTALIVIFLAFSITMIAFVKLTTGFETIEQEYVIYIILGYYVVSAFSSIFQQTFIAEREIVKNEIPIFLSTIIQSPAKILVAILSLGVIALAGAYLLGIIVVFLASLFFFRKQISFSFDREMSKKYLRFAFPLIISSVITVIFLHIDNIMIQIFWASKDVGIFFGARRITDILDILSTSVSTVLFPSIASLSVINTSQFISKVRLSERYLSMVLVPIILIIILFSRQIVSIILGPSFSDSAIVLQVLSLSVIMISLNRVYVVQFLSADKPAVITIVNILNILVHLMLNFILIPVNVFGIQMLGFGAYGAALSLLLSFLISTIIFRILVYRHFGYFPITPNVFYHASVALLIYFILSFIETSATVTFIIIAPIILVAYFFILYLLKEFSRNDLNFFMDAINPKKMKRYISDGINN